MRGLKHAWLDIPTGGIRPRLGESNALRTGNK